MTIQPTCSHCFSSFRVFDKSSSFPLFCFAHTPLCEPCTLKGKLFCLIRIAYRNISSLLQPFCTLASSRTHAVAHALLFPQKVQERELQNNPLPHITPIQEDAFLVINDTLINSESLDRVGEIFLEAYRSRPECVLHLYMMANTLFSAKESENSSFQMEKETLLLAFRGKPSTELFSYAPSFGPLFFSLFPKKKKVAMAIFQQIFDKQLDAPEMICGILKQSPHLMPCFVECWGEELFDYFSNKESFFQELLIEVDAFALTYMAEFVLEQLDFGSFFSDELAKTLIIQSGKQLSKLHTSLLGEELTIIFLHTLQKLYKASSFPTSIKDTIQKSEFVGCFSRVYQSKTTSASTKEAIANFFEEVCGTLQDPLLKRGFDFHL